MDINIIREAYPNPMRMTVDTDYRDPSCYCVGGGVARFYGLVGELVIDCFPDRDDLAAVYRHVNPLLPERQAHDLAGWTIAHNDAGQIDQAWRDADNAINYTPPKED